ncbi:phosphoinositide 3-kinase regulatory subunit 6 isoform X2 [Clupea harengus]|uniref:Phosphoinositide 3-kinase regulatory subunit 6 isoform X2 n=1 Tax=Clupea harengus TaxID=7950 RepID=A0A6P8FVJ6_CLUHA|nr:phosphoinositide 3-kinase regulatory subunit 6 isoform X2 [Clupea harengus]
MRQTCSRYVIQKLTVNPCILWVVVQNSGGSMSSAIECNLYRSIQAILKELDCPSQAASTCNRGMLRWTLHKRIENNPSHCVSLLRVLVKELERVERVDYKSRIIPLLHMSAYVVLQSVHIPEDLYERMYISIKKLITLPEPYCTVSLAYAQIMKMEMGTPGLLYQRRLITEQSLKNNSYTLQEKVFVFADPAVFPESLVSAVRADVEFTSPNCGVEGHMQRAVLHCLQATLGRHCHGPRLAQALEGCGVRLRKHFQEVVTAVEESVEAVSCDPGHQRTRLQQTYTDIMNAAKQDPSASGEMCGVPLPCPEISFNSWKQEEQIWNELVNFALMISPCERSFDDDEMEERRGSIMSNDSGIEGDLPAAELSTLSLEPEGASDAQSEQRHSSQFIRWNCVRRMKLSDRMALVRESVRATSRSDPFPHEERNHTGRVLIMGDDRALGRLAKTYLSIRKREARHLLLTKRLNLEMYYIPVSNDPVLVSSEEDSTTAQDNKLTLARFLGSVDPWYDCNINSLGAMMLKLANMSSSTKGASEPSPFLADIISYYIRTAFQPVHLPIYSIKITFSKLNASPVEDVFVSHVQMDFPEFKSLKASLKGSLRHKRATQLFRGAVVAVNYTKASLSKREVDTGITLRTCSVVIGAAPSSGTKDLNSLSVTFNDLFPRPCMVSAIRTNNIKIQSLEKRPLTVCLDKDSRRTFSDVQSIEITPCLDPGYCLQKSAKSKHTLEEEEEESALSKYMSRTLTLPINTFSGVIH